MMTEKKSRTRRNVLRSTVAVAGMSVLAGCGGDGGDGGEETPTPGENGTPGDGETATPGDGGGGDWEGFMEGANGFDGSVVDATGEDNITVAVGAGDDNLAFDPAAIRVSSGNTVVWEWTGEGGQHNVKSVDSEFQSDLHSEEGVTYEYTFESTGAFPYVCEPHRSLGMKGVVIVE